MTGRRTGMSLLCCGLAVLSVRCAPQPPGELAVLPMPELDLLPPSSARPGSGHVGEKLPPADAGRHEWAAKGYRPWRHIVIHHSATVRGSAALFDKAHRDRGWDELGYHFVIDNGDGGPDGRVEVGPRWGIQKWGAHTGGTPENEYNNFGIGICLVGDFGRRMPSPRQLASLERLVGYLVREYDIPPERVIGHRDAPNATTECPGDRLYEYLYGTLRPRLARQVAARGR